MFNSFSAERIRKDFPLLKQKIVYLDNACMTLKPQTVLDKMNEYYTEYTACSGRSLYAFSQRVKLEVEKARSAVQKFLGAKMSDEVVFNRNTTEGLNVVAEGLNLQKGDEVILSDKEHNSNLLPWLRLREKGVAVVHVESNPDNTFNLEIFERSFTKYTKVVSVVHTSNVDGVTNPLKEIAKITHERGAVLVVDGAQSVPSKSVDVRKLDVDFLAFSGHKILGPTGTGVLYGKRDLLAEMEPLLLGGGTVVDTTYDGYILDRAPAKFEAGLQDYAGILGLGVACQYLEKVGVANIDAHMKHLNEIVTRELVDHPKVRILGPRDPHLRSGIFSFVPEGMDIHHVAKMLDVSKKILVRSGTHCVHSWFNAHQLKGSVRASFYLYNTEEEARLFAAEVKKILKLVQ